MGLLLGRGELIGEAYGILVLLQLVMLHNIACYVTTLTIIVLVLSITIVGDHKTSKVSLRKDG